MKKETKKNWAVILLICSMSTLFSCKENKETEVLPEFPVTLYPIKVVKEQSVRMFTDGKEIFDQTKISKFIDNCQQTFTVPAQEYLNNSQENSTIIFSTKDAVVFGDNNAVRKVIADTIYITINEPDRCFSVTKNNNLFLLYSKYAINVGFLYPFTKYAAEIIQTADIGGAVLKTQQVVAAFGKYTELELCFICYKYVSYDDYWYGTEHINYCSFAAAGSGIFSQFDETGMNTLTINDTLAIKEYRILFKELK